MFRKHLGVFSAGSLEEPMITFSCTSCRKALQVDDDLAGAEVPCPGCGQVMEVPNPIEIAVSSSEHVRSTKSGIAPPTQPTRTAPLSSPTQLPTVAPSGASDVTRSRGDKASAPPDHEAALTDFLAPAEAADELGRLGGFRILQVLGHGGMGVVFLGEDLKLGRKVAIKAMLPHLAGSRSSQERFLREARAAAALEHDHIVAIHHVGEDCGAPFIVMPFLKGEPLDGRLQRDGKLPVPEVLRIGREIAKGLAVAHAAGLIHRDIKPANVWLEAPEDRVKILDFGLARPAQDGGLTQQGAIIGTPAYMAPEQSRGETVDARCDLWSLGVVLYRMCTGQLPFQGSDTISTLLAVVTHNPPPPAQLNAEVPPVLSDLVMRLLEKDPAQRIASAAEVVAVLRSMEQNPSASQPVKVAPARQKAPVVSAQTAAPGGKSRTVLLMGLGATVAALLAGFLLLRPTAPTEVPTENAGTGDEVDLPPPAKDEPLPPKFTNALGMKFALVPRGKAWLGGGGGKVGDREVDSPNDFYLGVYEVTQDEWHAVMGKIQHHSHFSLTAPGRLELKRSAIGDTRQFPVESVTWDFCQDFLHRVNERTAESGWAYRLPTAFEWEYACRGGPGQEKEDYGFDYYLSSPSNQLRIGDENFKGTKLQRTCKVGSYSPNRLGLYDMHGNVSEWCADAANTDGRGTPQRVYKGGSWSSDAQACRAAYRGSMMPNVRSADLGFRVARVRAGKGSN
jgi:formylglycine-generating enzyme required for sulfatase activity